MNAPTPTPKRYLVLPVTAYGDWMSDINEAKNRARDVCAQFGEDMVVVAVEFVGMYEKVSPLWQDDDPTTKAIINLAPAPY